MNMKNLIMIGIGAVVLYVIYKKFYVEKEETASASGTESPCVCQGYFIGNMSDGKCKRMCRKANNFNF